jgi:hypothetical protein
MISSGRSVNRPPHILLLMTNRSYPSLFVAAADIPGATEVLQIAASGTE